MESAVVPSHSAFFYAPPFVLRDGDFCKVILVSRFPDQCFEISDWDIIHRTVCIETANGLKLCSKSLRLSDVGEFIFQRQVLFKNLFHLVH